MRTLKLAAVGLAALPWLMSCSSNSTAPRTDIITVSPSTSTATLLAGQSQTVSISITRPVGYVGPITLKADGAPSGVTATITPTTLAPADNNATLTLTADAGAVNGSGSVRVSAFGTNVAEQSATITVTVGVDAGNGSFTMFVSPSSLTIARGQTGSATISITPSGGFSGSVSLDVSGLGGGINATVSPGSTSSGNATISLMVPTNAPTGTYAGVVTAQGPNGQSQTASISVTVLAAIRAPN